MFIVENPTVELKERLKIIPDLFNFNSNVRNMFKENRPGPYADALWTVLLPRLFGINLDDDHRKESQNFYYNRIELEKIFISYKFLKYVADLP